MAKSNQDTLFSCYLKGREHYLLVYRPDQVARARGTVIRWFLNPELNFNAKDLDFVLEDIHRATTEV